MPVLIFLGLVLLVMTGVVFQDISVRDWKAHEKGSYALIFEVVFSWTAIGCAVLSQWWPAPLDRITDVCMPAAGLGLVLGAMGLARDAQRWRAGLAVFGGLLGVLVALMTSAIFALSHSGLGQ